MDTTLQMKRNRQTALQDSVPQSEPSEKFEFTANSLGAHIETHGGLILRTLSYLTVNSQDDSHCELSGSLQLTQ